MKPMFYFSPFLFFISTILGILLTFVPLFEIVGYESAAISGVIASILSLIALQKNVREGTLDPKEMYQVSRFWVESWLLIGPTLCVLVLNGLRVETCAWGEGFLFWIIIPPISMAIVQSLWILGHVIHTRFAWVMVILAVLSEVVIFFWRLANEPPIARYEWLIGWFSGSIYDEALSVPFSLIVYRTYCLFCAVLILRVAMLYVHRRGLVSVAVLMCVVGGLRYNGPSLMFMHTHNSVQKSLGGRLETEHAIIYFSSSNLTPIEQNHLKQDVEFRYQELKYFFQEDPVVWKKSKMEIYVYPNAEVQQELMGSRRTFVARPWTHQMHLRWEEIGDSVLAHEMAHLFTAPFAPWPFRLAVKNGIGVDTGLVEGIAVAADWPPDELDPHRASAALRILKKAPDIRLLFGAGGFWSQPSGKAYTMTGSFVRWLVDEYGIEKFKKLYRTGDMEDAFGVDVYILIEKWESFLDTIVLEDRDIAIAEHRYSRRTIFEKVCARSLAETKRIARQAYRSQSYDVAMTLYEQALEKEPNNPRSLYAKSRILMAKENWFKAEEWIGYSLQKDLGVTYKALFIEQLGDIYWHRGEIEKARIQYKKCLSFGLRDAQRRTLLAKIQSLEEPKSKRFFLDRHNRIVSVFILMSWAQDKSKLASYLTGLQLWSLSELEGAIQFLRGAQFDSIELEEQRMLMLGKAYVMNDQKELSKPIWNELQNAQQNRIRMEVQEWILRSD
ncbi:MAG: hypothetical protein CL916_06835 [Deltaproteobacteria bacterium]|nr:hypothetical protein [Deltaproteobacteria bacterium]